MYDKSGKLADRRELLKIKFNALMTEAWIIREAERKQLAYGKKAALPHPWLYEEMHQHRVLPLRREARLTALALGFIRGRTLEQMECQSASKRPLRAADWKAIMQMVAKYGSVSATAHANEQHAQAIGLTAPQALKEAA